MSFALEGIRVIDFGQYLAAPLTAMMLADQGADVVRIDPPGGPRWRHPANAVLQRGKRSRVLDLKTDEDRQAARDLVLGADVVLENFRPGVMDRLGLGAEAMTAANPRLIYCSLPGFARDDPRAGLAGWEGVVTAATGIYYPSLRGRNNFVDDPIYSAVPLASSYAAFIAAHGIVAALIARRRLGRGQRLEVPLFDAALQVLGSTQFQDGRLFVNFTPPATKSELPLIRRHRCADGRYVDISPPWRGVDFFAERFLPKEFLESGITHDKSPAAVAEVERVLRELFLTRTAAEWEAACQEAGTGIAICQTTDEWLHDQHAIDSRCVIALDDPELGPTRQAGYPVGLSKTPPEAQGPRHRLDTDREAVLREATGKEANSSLSRQGEGRGEGEPRALDALQSSPPKPDTRYPIPAPRALEGVRVVDASQILAGPTACRVLAEYGADVIKINNPRLDENLAGTMAHTYVNNGKRTVLLDLKSPAGKEVLGRLLERADVFHQNFALGTVARLGIGEDKVRRHRADIVYSSVNTHAQGGFRSVFRGHEELGQAITGMEVRFGGDGEPARVGWPVCDYATGHLSAFAIMLALFHRLRTGEGQHVRASLSQSGTYLQIPFMIAYEGQVRDEPRGLDAKGWGPLYRLYKASDGWFFLAAEPPASALSQRKRAKGTGKERLAKVEGLQGVDGAAAGDLETLLAARFGTETAAVWVSRLSAAGISAQPARRVEEVMLDEDLRRRGATIDRDHPGVGVVRSIGRALRCSLTPIDPLAPAPPVGWHGREVVAEVGLGDRFEALVAQGAVGAPAGGASVPAEAGR